MMMYCVAYSISGVWIDADVRLSAPSALRSRIGSSPDALSKDGKRTLEGILAVPDEAPADAKHSVALGSQSEHDVVLPALAVNLP